MKKINIALVTILISFNLLSCTSYSDRIIEKTIPIDNNRYIEWYYYSLITSFGPAHLELKYKTKDDKFLFYKSGGLCQVSIESDTIRILSAEGEPILIKNKVDGLAVYLDTTCKGVYLYKDQ